jgi:SRSO17 transposase
VGLPKARPQSRGLKTSLTLKTLAAAVKARWICEQAHQQLKEELGLDHFEGRSWAGFVPHEVAQGAWLSNQDERNIT